MYWTIQEKQVTVCYAADKLTITGYIHFNGLHCIEMTGVVQLVICKPHLTLLCDIKYGSTLPRK